MPALSSALAGFAGVRSDEPLAGHSQYGIGGRADWYLEVSDAKELPEIAATCASQGIPITVVGAGSNTLILDGGVRGLVLRITDKSWSVDGDEVEAAAGVMLPRLALDLAKKGLAGMEFGIGVPGTCGASVRGNAGAFGTEVKDVMVSCQTVDRSGSTHTRTTEECAFAYRTSALKSGPLKSEIVMSAIFSVHPDDPVATRARTDEIQASRKASQPYGIRSLGSVFTNPDGDHAGRLIEAAGLKGRQIGGAQISPKHANFIVNVDHATAADVLALVQLAHDEVLQRFGVDLEREIVVMGEPA